MREKVKKTMSINGKWYSFKGSELILTEEGSELKGTFDSVQDPNGARPLHRSVDPDPSLPNRTLSFSVAWIKGDASSGPVSVTSYTGQYHGGGGTSFKEFIDVVFLLANETSPAKEYASVFVGHDRFTRDKPPAHQIEDAVRTMPHLR